MAKVVQPSLRGGSAIHSDGWFDLVAAEALTIALPPNIKAVAFTTSGSGAGATMTITLS